MITTLKLENFMGVEEAYYDTSYLNPKTRKPVPRQRIQITGGEGVGKTRILKALIFAFTGRNLDGDVRPHKLISKGEEEASVTVLGPNGFELTRSIDRKRRAVKTTCGCRGVPFINSTEGYKKAVGHSPEAVLAASLPGYFQRLSVRTRRMVFEEHVRRGGGFELKNFLIQIAYQGEVTTKDHRTEYKDFDQKTKNLADLEVCCMFQESLFKLVNPHKFIFWDDADLVNWPDVVIPDDVQLFVTKRVPKAALTLTF